MRMLKSEIPDPIVNNALQLTFEVKKGSRVKIEWIDIQGNDQLTDQKLKRTLKNTKQKDLVEILEGLEIHSRRI